MTINILLSLGIMIFSGMLLGRLVKFLKLPNVTGYLIAGLLIGPSVFNIVDGNSIENMGVISEVALGFIAFTIGSEFKISYFKKVGSAPIVIAIFESLMAVVLVTIALVSFGNSLSFSLVLGSIAAATAPAATVMVIRQYKAKGPVTETLLSVVAIDDAVALIMFGICVAISGMLTSSNANILALLISPIIEIVGAIVVGFVLGLAFTYFIRMFKKDGNKTSLTVGFVFFGLGIAAMLNLSSLLLCMAMGAALTNFSKQDGAVMKLVDNITPPIFMLFFVASGAELQLSILPSIGLVGVVYIVFRVIGKLFGAYIGATISKSSSNIKKYLGLALVPQAGVAIGLSLVATTVLPEHGQTIRAVILCATLVYELVGPAFAKIALKKSGEI